MFWHSLLLANHSPGWSQERANQKAQLWVWLQDDWLGGKLNRQNRLLRHSETVRLQHCCTCDSPYWRSTSAIYVAKIKITSPKGRVLGRRGEMAKQEQKCCGPQQTGSRSTWLGQSSLASGNLCSSFRISYLPPSPRIPATVSKSSLQSLEPNVCR